MRMLHSLAKDESAVSAVEFGVLLPVMLLLLLGSFDIARGITVKTKTSLLSNTVSDFVSQKKTITPADLDAIVMASKAVLYPYASDQETVRISIESIRPDPNDTTKNMIDWSYKTQKTGTAVRTTDNVHDKVPAIPAETSAIQAKIEYTYKLKFAGFLGDRLGFDQIEMTSIANTSPRAGIPVEPTNF